MADQAPVDVKKKEISSSNNSQTTTMKRSELPPQQQQQHRQGQPEPDQKTGNRNAVELDIVSVKLEDSNRIIGESAPTASIETMVSPAASTSPIPAMEYANESKAIVKRRGRSRSKGSAGSRSRSRSGTRKASRSSSRTKKQLAELTVAQRIARLESMMSEVRKQIEPEKIHGRARFIIVVFAALVTSGFYLWSSLAFTSQAAQLAAEMSFALYFSIPFAFASNNFTASQKRNIWFVITIMVLTYLGTNIYNTLNRSFLFFYYGLLDLWFGVMIMLLNLGELSGAKIRLSPALNFQYEDFVQIFLGAALLFRSSDDDFASTINPILILYFGIIKLTKTQGAFRRFFGAMCVLATLVLFLADSREQDYAKREIYNITAQGIYVFYITLNIDSPWLASCIKWANVLIYRYIISGMHLTASERELFFGDNSYIVTPKAGSRRLSQNLPHPSETNNKHTPRNSTSPN